MTLLSFRDLLVQPTVGLSAAGFTVKRSVWTKTVTEDVLWRVVLRQDPDERPYVGELLIGALVPGVSDLLPDHYPDSTSPGLAIQQQSAVRPSRPVASRIDVRDAGRTWWGRSATDPNAAALELLRARVADGLQWLGPLTTVDAVVTELEARCRLRGRPPAFNWFLYLAGIRWRQGDASGARNTVQAGLLTQKRGHRDFMSRSAAQYLRALEDRYPQST